MQPLRYTIKQRQVATRQAGYKEAGHTLDKRQGLAGWRAPGAMSRGEGDAAGGQRFLCTSCTATRLPEHLRLTGRAGLTAFPVKAFCFLSAKTKI